MSLLDNIGDVAFASRYPIDKIVATDTASLSVVASDGSTTETSTLTEAHGQGSNVVVSGMYSIDGTNFYPLGALVQGSVLGGGSSIEQFWCDAACDGTNVFIRAISLFLDAKTVTVNLFYESIA